MDRMALRMERNFIRWEDINSRHLLGRIGDRNIIYSGRWNGLDVILKSFPLREDEGGRLQAAVDEAERMCHIHHPFSILYLGYFHHVDPNMGDFRFWIVMERAYYGSLRSIYNGDLDWATRVRYARDIACAMWTIHHNYGVIHRDLKLSNILLTDYGSIKIREYGFSVFDQELAHTFLGEIFYTAPEVIRRQVYSFPSDVFSFSMILWELLHQREVSEGYPVEHRGEIGAQREHMLEGGRPAIDPAVQQNFVDQFGQRLWDRLSNLMQNCWNDNPDYRYTFEDIHEQLYHVHTHMNIRDEEVAQHWIENNTGDLITTPEFLHLYELVPVLPYDRPYNLFGLFDFMRDQRFVDDRGTISIKQIGRLIGYYGHLVENPVFNMAELSFLLPVIANLPYFHADIVSNQEAEVRLNRAFTVDRQRYFLVRVSATVGLFTISEVFLLPDGTPRTTHEQFSINHLNPIPGIPFLDLFNRDDFAGHGLPCPKDRREAFYIGRAADPHAAALRVADPRD